MIDSAPTGTGPGDVVAQQDDTADACKEICAEAIGEWQSHHDGILGASQDTLSRLHALHGSSKQDKPRKTLD
jgi:hypothetical protein